MPLSIPASPAMAVPRKSRNSLYCGLLVGDYTWTQIKMTALAVALAVNLTTWMSMIILLGSTIYKQFMEILNEIIDKYLKIQPNKFPAILDINRKTVRRVECKALTRVLNNPRWRYLKKLGFDGITESDRYNIGSSGNGFGAVFSYLGNAILNMGMAWIASQLLEMLQMEESLWRKLMRNIEKYENQINYGSDIRIDNAYNQLTDGTWENNRAANALGGFLENESMRKYLNRLDEYANCNFDGSMLSCDYRNSSKNLKSFTMRKLKIRQVNTIYKVDCEELEEIATLRARLYGKINAVIREYHKQAEEPNEFVSFSRTIENR